MASTPSHIKLTKSITMKKATFLALAFGLAAASSQASTTYLAIDGGAFILDDIAGVNVETGYGINAAVGFQMNANTALEIQTGYYQADMDDMLSGISVSGDVTLIPVLANVKYAVKLTDAAALDLGAGVGAFYGEADATAGLAGFTASASSDGWEFGAQALAGISFKLSESMDLNLNYRFLYIGQDDEVTGHFVGGGLTFRF
jgi:opacity protein-like surface antigen